MTIKSSGIKELKADNDALAASHADRRLIHFLFVRKNIVIETEEIFFFILLLFISRKKIESN